MRDRKEVDRLHDAVLKFFDKNGDNEDATRNPSWSFECGILAAMDWLVECDNSVYAIEVNDLIKSQTTQEGVDEERIRAIIEEFDCSVSGWLSKADIQSILGLKSLSAVDRITKIMTKQKLIKKSQKTPRGFVMFALPGETSKAPS